VRVLDSKEAGAAVRPCGRGNGMTLWGTHVVETDSGDELRESRAVR
jgi:hypothetical protein